MNKVTVLVVGGFAVVGTALLGFAIGRCTAKGNNDYDTDAVIAAAAKAKKDEEKVAE